VRVTLDLDLMLSENEISQAEYEKLSELATRSTGSLAFNILIGFGVIAVSGAALALVPAPATAIVIGLSILVAGLALLRNGLEQWKVLANICILVGALMTGGGIVTEFKASFVSMLSVTAIFAAASMFSRSSPMTPVGLRTTLGISARPWQRDWRWISWWCAKPQPWKQNQAG
jgi:iron complex transport system permease protein